MNLNVVFFSNEFFQCRLVTEDWWDCTDSAWGFCESWKLDKMNSDELQLQNVQWLIDRFVATSGLTLVAARKLYLPRKGEIVSLCQASKNGDLKAVQDWFHDESCFWLSTFLVCLEDFLAKKKPLDSQDHKAHDARISCSFILPIFSLSKIFGDCLEELCWTHVIFGPAKKGACCNIEGRNPSFESKEQGT